ncbi:hypothetical protein AD945_12985 [Gluconobacter albidus]|uniref:Uncharacterized protein n=1 Tax=Gluconobacter albidus TaxID=318683 RepID=A0A149TG94_9PROT|nr:hypothetical protein [Gluconobacter albidus]KXV46525.1 hypothetical protein AD945_12985 [Gluconobacter albidus]
MSKILITKAGQDILARKMKHALDTALLEGPRTTEEIMISLVILLIGGKYDYKVILDRITGRDGDGGFRRMEQVDVEDIAIETIQRLTQIIPPHKRTSAGRPAESYQIGELIGSIINADTYLSNMATSDVLTHVPRHTLMELIKDALPAKDLARMCKGELIATIVSLQADWHPTSFSSFTEDLS